MQYRNCYKKVLTMAMLLTPYNDNKKNKIGNNKKERLVTKYKIMSPKISYLGI